MFYIKGIYCIINLVNNKRYIGQTIDIERRLQRHLYDLKSNKHINQHLQNAWNKYGEDNFKLYIIEEVQSTDDLMNTEIKYIESFNSFINGYNQTIGGESGNTSFLGKSHSEESKRKMRVAKLGRKLTDEHRKKIGDAQKGDKHWTNGKNFSDETKLKISEAKKGRKLSPEHIEKCRQMRIGFKHSEESKRKMSESAKGKPKSMETKRKMSESKSIRFTKEQELEISSMISQGISYRKIGEKFHVSYTTISRRFGYIKKGCKNIKNIKDVTM